MKLKNDYSQMIFGCCSVLIYLFKCYSSSFLCGRLGFCILSASCALFCLYFVRQRMGYHFWRNISADGSLLYLAVPALVWLYLDLLPEFRSDCMLFLICGTCLSLLINHYAHDSFGKTAVIGSVYSAGSLWLAVENNMSPSTLTAISIAGILSIILGSHRYRYDRNIKYNRIYVLTIFLAVEAKIFSGSSGLSHIAHRLMEFYYANMFDLNGGLLLTNYKLYACLILWICGAFAYMSHQRIRTSPSVAYSLIILGYLAVEKWNLSSCMVFVIIAGNLFLHRYDRFNRT